MGQTTRGYRPSFFDKVWVVTSVEGDGDLRPSKVLGGGGSNCQDLLGCEFLLPLGLIRVEATKNIVEFAQPRTILLLSVRPFNCIENTVPLSLLIMALG
jgi:hypothetical protein